VADFVGGSSRIDQYRLANSKGRLLTEPTLQVKGYQTPPGGRRLRGGALERETDSVGSALKTFQQAATSLLPVVDEAQQYLNRRLWPFTALNSWTESLSTGFNS
jgi:hypothetical protein